MENNVRNIKNIKKIFIFALLALGLTACSNQEITVDAAVSAAEMQEDLNIILNENTTLSAGSASNFRQLAEDPNTSIYYSRSGPMGSVYSVLAMYNINWLAPGLTRGEISQVMVFFLDNITNQGRQVALLVDVLFTDGRAPLTQVFDINQSIATDGDEIEFIVSNGVDQLILRSFDLQDGLEELNASIQLNVFMNNNGTEDYLGKFSALMGFGQ